ncbi:hypothetical protein SDC9_170245 [bioreactor metagenome]|uniref:Uncharacterized protein n=1 Tax=bioreactor metagenome TaxID=1076179 RepID=A0A645GA04_9ZZZZ
MHLLARGEASGDIKRASLGACGCKAQVAAHISQGHRAAGRCIGHHRCSTAARGAAGAADAVHATEPRAVVLDGRHRGRSGRELVHPGMGVCIGPSGIAAACADNAGYAVDSDVERAAGGQGQGARRYCKAAPAPSQVAPSQGRGGGSVLGVDRHMFQGFEVLVDDNFRRILRREPLLQTHVQTLSMVDA